MSYALCLCLLFMKIVLSELEHEVAAKSHLKTELEIAKEMESKSAGKIKYYMRVGCRFPATLQMLLSLLWLYMLLFQAAACCHTIYSPRTI